MIMENLHGLTIRELQLRKNLTKTQHDATKSIYRDWLFEKTGRVGGKVDWSKNEL